MIWIFTLILIGFFFWLTNLQVLVLSRDWPLILILIGLINIIKLIKVNKRHTIVNNLENGKISVQEAEEKLKKSH
ncbi:MAG: hypothetical protein E3J47_04810 [Candidatus Stahlbacteria bacterium]|jgi:tetrahydromethanopterin S-methyltransferase subunit E|nr:hypothetical protein [candidate division WOR-3 bacterium]TET61706.1 MAG: hypothetical protein E3J47_04810 [Candidatus Stahlbacteria bacterium]